MCSQKLVPVLALAFVFSVAFAADEAGKMSDQDFVKEAAMGGMFEVKAGKLATEKGSEAVRSFGTQMIIDHGKANDELKALAAKKGWTLPDKLDDKHQQKLDHFASLNQNDFDREYIEDMKKDHHMDVDAFRSASQHLNDAELRAFASKTLPVVEAHMKHIDGMAPGGLANAAPVPPRELDTQRQFNTGAPRFPEGESTVTGQAVNSGRYFTESADGQRTYITDPNFSPCLER